MKTHILALTFLSLAPACGSSEGDQTPPIGAAAVEAWLTDGAYKSWACEPTAHDSRSPSPHGKNRICSNELLSAHTTGTYPVGSASVKELFDDAGANIIGYAVYLKTTTATTGAAWYLYERVPLDHPAPHDSAGVVADGQGTSGPALAICVGCHNGAGIDAQHSGHDFVYTQVK